MVPCSTIELLTGFLATCDSPAGHLRLYHEIEQYGLPVQGVDPFPQHSLARVADGRQYCVPMEMKFEGFTP